MDARRASLLQHAAAIPPTTKYKWQKAFNDIQQNRVISAPELAQVMAEKLNMIVKPGEVEAMINAVDLDQDGVVNYQEFELMMVAAGRGGAGGFAHIVDRFIRMSEIAGLITTEANGFVHKFFQQHREQFYNLPTPDVNAVEQQQAWFDTWQMFKEEGELMMQNTLLLWGTAQMKTFDPDFLEELNRTGILGSFLQYLDYPKFMRKMYETVHLQGSDDHPGTMTPRPETPMRNGGVQQRLKVLDQELAMLDYQRNQILAERRRLVGCEVGSVTTGALKQQLEMVKYREDVGND